MAGALQHEDVGWLHPDEPCWELKEFDRLGADFLEHRIQQVIVVRNESPVTFEADLGHSWNFDCGDFNIWGGAKDSVTGKVHVDHHVGELMEWAEEARGRRPTWSHQEYFETATETILDDLRMSVIEGKAQEKKESVFGPAQTKVRN